MVKAFLLDLSNRKPVRRLIHLLGIHFLVNWWIGRFPITRRVCEGRIRYRARHTENLYLARELFADDSMYDPDLFPANYRTFADLGCNVGYFTCWLAHHAQGRQLKGLMVDANPEAVEESKWHVRTNQLTEVQVVQGVAGHAGQEPSTSFYLHQSNLCSTTTLSPDIPDGSPSRWREIRVPCLHIGNEWNQRFGSLRCNVLKVDIEGSELDFFRKEGTFLELVDSVLVEWHEWRVHWDELKACLEESGFSLVRILDRQEVLGTAFFERKRDTQTV